MRWRSLALHTIAECVSLVGRPFVEQEGLRIITYHTVGSEAHEDRLGLNTITVERFREHVDVLAKMLSVPLSPLAIPANQLKIAVTFDDGYADNLHVVAPLLVERSIPFTVFVTSDFIRGNMTGFLSPIELQELARLPGVIIGAHGRSHCNLTLCSDKQLHAELVDSKRYLEDLIGLPVASLAYPYGATDVRVRDTAQFAGYEIGTCSRFDINHVGRDALMLNRCVILSEDTQRILRQKLKGDWDWYRFRSADPLGLMKVAR
jgi:peptidoglycan/xylan/chitin deacetylase (PgdA/CDA1 family)